MQAAGAWRAASATYVCSASTQEYHAYPELYARAKTAIGRPPVAVVADRGFSVASVFEAHTRDGVASVIAWRKSNHTTVRKDHERYDCHGVPFCKHCGFETRFVSFAAKTGPKEEPRLWVSCVRPKTGTCHGKQTILCKENWRMLLPLWRTTEAYQVMRASHQNYEHAHLRWRESYGVAGDSRADRPKRRGLGVQQLRSSAALILEWLTICHRQGWLPGSELLNTQPEVAMTRARAASYTTRIVAYRRDRGLSTTAPASHGKHLAEVAAFHAGSAKSSRRARATVAAARGEPE